MASKRETIKLKCEGSGIFYSTKKNKSNTPKRLELKKYCSIQRKHVVFKESK